MTRPSPQLARIAELERVYADEYPTAPREQRKRWAVEGAQYEADERASIAGPLTSDFIGVGSI